MLYYCRNDNAAKKDLRKRFFFLHKAEAIPRYMPVICDDYLFSVCMFVFVCSGSLVSVCIFAFVCSGSLACCSWPYF